MKNIVQTSAVLVALAAFSYPWMASGFSTDALVGGILCEELVPSYFCADKFTFDQLTAGFLLPGTGGVSGGQGQDGRDETPSPAPSEAPDLGEDKVDEQDKGQGEQAGEDSEGGQDGAGDRQNMVSLLGGPEAVTASEPIYPPSYGPTPKPTRLPTAAPTPVSTRKPTAAPTLSPTPISTLPKPEPMIVTGSPTQVGTTDDTTNTDFPTEDGGIATTIPTEDGSITDMSLGSSPDFLPAEEASTLLDDTVEPPTSTSSFNDQLVESPTSAPVVATEDNGDHDIISFNNQGGKDNDKAGGGGGKNDNKKDDSDHVSILAFQREQNVTKSPKTKAPKTVGGGSRNRRRTMSIRGAGLR
jgi:hypothetical protein